jgi:hypothetical protein
MGERGAGNTSYQRGHPRKDGLPVRRQLRPHERSLLEELRSIIATHEASKNGLDPVTQAEELLKIQGYISFNKLQLRTTQARFGQPVDPE